MSNGKKWWERLVERLSRKGAIHKVGGDGYRASEVIEPEWMPWHAKAIEWCGPRIDAVVGKIFQRRTAFAIAVAVSVIGIILTGFIGYKRFVLDAPSETDHGTVASVYWEYSMLVRAREIHHLSSWHDDLAPHAFNVVCHEEQRGTRDCNPHPCVRTSVSSRGRVRARVSTCYDQCPHYEDWCRYDAPAWPVAMSDVSEGNDHSPVMPASIPTDIPWCSGDNEGLLPATRCREAQLVREIRFIVNAEHHHDVYEIEGDDKIEMRQHFDRFTEGACWIGTESGHTFTPAYECEKVFE